MRVNIEKRSGSLITTLTASPDTTVEELKQQFYLEKHYYPERQRFTTVGGVVLTDGKLSDYKLTDNAVLHFKDLGVQMSWRLVYVAEYLGPLLITPFIYYAPKIVYGRAVHHSFAQTVAFWLIVVHFLKRELESLFVHRFSHATMPIHRLPINCFHYWILCSLSISYYLFHPEYTPPFKSNKIYLTLGAIMMVFEFCNLQCHLIQRNLRPRNSKIRSIPHGWGYDAVSCANYFWESMAWLTFCIATNTLSGWIFFIAAFGQMAQWAIKKHQRYFKEFKDYPTNRRAIIPYLL